MTGALFSIPVQKENDRVRLAADGEEHTGLVGVRFMPDRRRGIARRIFFRCS
jgi:hypothetical protein